MRQRRQLTIRGEAKGLWHTYAAFYEVKYVFYWFPLIHYNGASDETGDSRRHPAVPRPIFLILTIWDICWCGAWGQVCGTKCGTLKYTDHRGSSRSWKRRVDVMTFITRPSACPVDRSSRFRPFQNLRSMKEMPPEIIKILASEAAFTVSRFSPTKIVVMFDGVDRWLTSCAACHLDLAIQFRYRNWPSSRNVAISSFFIGDGHAKACIHLLVLKRDVSKMKLLVFISRHVNYCWLVNCYSHNR